MALAINAHRLLVITNRGQRLLTSSTQTWQAVDDTNGETLTMIRSKRYFWAAVCADGGLLICGKPHKFMDFLLRRDIPVQKMPRTVFGGAPVVMVACGAFHAMVLTANGRVFAWGANYNGQLGLAVQRSLATPTALAEEAFGEHGTVASIAAGDLHSIAITRTGLVWAWGHAEHGQLGLGDAAPLSAVAFPRCATEVPCAAFAAAGRKYTIMVDHNGQVWSTGENHYGQLGHGDRVARSVFACIATPAAFCTQRICSLDCADDHSAAVTDRGEVWTWGCNRSGCLGLNEKKSSLVPAQVRSECFGEGVCLASVFCGEECTAVVSTRGDLFLWGAKRRNILRHRYRHELGRATGMLHPRSSMPVHIFMHGPVGRGARLPLRHELAFAMVLHARLGRKSVFFELHVELLQKILEECRDSVQV